MGQVVNQSGQKHRTDQALLQQSAEPLQPRRQLGRRQAPAPGKHPQQRVHPGMAHIGQQPLQQRLAAESAVQQAALERLIEADQGQGVVPERAQRKRFQRLNVCSRRGQGQRMASQWQRSKPMAACTPVF